MLSQLIGNWILDGVYLLVLGLLGLVGPRVAKWYQAHTTVAERSILAGLAQGAVLLVEKNFPQVADALKAEKAFAYVDKWLKSKGLGFTVEEIQAEIEKAWSAYKGSGTLALYHEAAPPEPTPATPAAT